MTLLGNLWIRRATADDVAACEKIARQFGSELGFVRRNGLLESVERRGLHVAYVRADNSIAGFVEFRQCVRGANAGYSVVYHLAVSRDYQRMDIGRQLLYSVPHPVRLKVTVDNPANAFYQASGMTLLRTEQGRKRPLNVYQRRVLFAWVQGGNQYVPVYAKQAGMAYGTRHDTKPHDYCWMLDIKWKDYDWAQYMDIVRHLRPVQAMVADYEAPEQRNIMLQQVQQLRDEGVLNIMVCPKFASAVQDIPADCIIAVSVPSRYAGYIPNTAETGNRKVHLLGGTPQKQLALLKDYNVVSADGNSHETSAKFSSVFDAGKWKRSRYVTALNNQDYHHSMQMSAHNITEYFAQAERIQQLSLFD